MPLVTAFYAGILGLISLVLSAKAGSIRGKTGISIGDGGNQELLLAMRKHSNFVEYVPLLLILIGSLEVNGVGSQTIHIMGACLVVFRVAHAFGLQAGTMRGIGRFVGAAGTAALTALTSIWLIRLFVETQFFS